MVHMASVFVSYSHADKPLAHAIANGLQGRNFRVWVDEGEIRIGDSLVEKVTDALDRVDFVVAIVSKTSVESSWCQKELSIAMTGEISKQGVTVMPCRVDDVVMPPSLKDKKYQELDRDNLTDAVDILVRDMGLFLEPPAQLPQRRRSPKNPTPKPDPSEPIRLVAVDTENVGVPRGDGTAGSALYVVPILLSRIPDQNWASLFVQTWDWPPSFTSMHRPGIAHVSGQRVILDGTTVDEVARYHQNTLMVVVEKTNEQWQELENANRSHQEKREAALLAHRRAVDDANAQIKFH